MISVRMPNFTPSADGFPFCNSFPRGTPVVDVRTPFGRVRLGDAVGGLCGGMVFGAMDFHGTDTPTIPGSPDPEVVRFLARRLLDSWNLPFGVLKYYDWQRRPCATKWIAGVRAVRGLTHLTALREWPRIRAELDAGRFAPLGVILARGFGFKGLPRNHQVLAYGYDLDAVAAAVTLHIYDPNYPGEDEMLKFHLRDPDAGRMIVHSCEGAAVRGLFLTPYRSPAFLPTF